MPTLLIRGGRIVDPANDVDQVADLLIRNGVILRLEASAGEAFAESGLSGPAGFESEQPEVIDAVGKIVCPGLVDLHCHLREPGGEEDETIATGTAAAVAGGFTTIASLAATVPPIDSAASVEYVRLQAERANNCRVAVVACVSNQREGKQLAEMGQLCEAGAVAFSDAPSPVYDPELMRRALQYTRMFNRPVLNHAEVPELTTGGVMHSGLVSLKLGLAGLPTSAEEVMVGRDIILSEATGGRVHVMHVSAAGAIELIRRAKRRGVQVTAEVSPQHFTLTDECLNSFDANYKINPPLRGEEDRQACIRGLIDGTIDCIVSDHAPHATEKKMHELDRAPFGVVSLETTLALVIDQLVRPGHLSWPQAVHKLSGRPAEILQLPAGTLSPGAPADVTVLDPEIEWTVDPATFRSRSRNTPYTGKRLRGRVDWVLVGGQVRYRSESFSANGS